MRDDLVPFETLERLSGREQVDARPILIRVLTDLFVQKPDHSAMDIARYEELAIRLLDVVGLEARAAVARKLAGEPRTPRAVIDRLVADEAQVSGPILARFPGLQRATLLARALDGGPVAASAVASRADIDADLVRVLARHPDPTVLETLAANGAADLGEPVLTALVERAAGAPALAAALLRREDLEPAALAPLYLQADPIRRDGIRKALAGRPPRPGSAPRAAIHAGTVEAAIQQATDAVGRAHLIAETLGDALSLKPGDAARLASEETGEVFVLMLRAAGVEPELVTRALLLARPEIATSVARIFELVGIAETISRAAAGEIVAALTGRPDRATPPRHEPLLDPSGAMERAGAIRPAPARRFAERQSEARRRG